MQPPLTLMQGLRELLDSQAAETAAAHVCGLCRRSLPDANLVDFTLAQLGVRHEIALQSNRSSKRMSRLISALAVLQPDVPPPPCMGPFRRASLVRQGSLIELRAQKHECLHFGECLACSRAFERAGELEAFLRMMDQQVLWREERLHMHINFCG